MAGPPAVPSTLDQLTFAAFLESGAYDRHLRAATAGARVANLDTYRAGDAAAGPGLVLGYGNLADGQVEEAVTLLAAAVAEVLG